MANQLIPALFIVAVIAYSYHAFRRAHRILDLWFHEHLDEFRSIKIHGALNDLCFDGSQAKIIKIERIGGICKNGPDRATFTTLIFARNPPGEYFMFRKTGGGKPIFKHVESKIARNVLGLDKMPPIDV